MGADHSIPHEIDKELCQELAGSDFSEDGD
jgi:hypothetical protein